MTLSVTGHPLHTRSLTAVASLREDRRWSVRGDVIDLRKCGFVPMTQDIQPSGIIHHMTLEMVIDPETLRLDELVASQPHVAIEASERTGGECCRDPVDRLQALVGEHLDVAFDKKLSGAFGGALGCSHLLTLFFTMAAAIPRAVAHESEIAARHGEPRSVGERLFWRSIFVDGHEDDDGSIILSGQLSDVHSRPHHAVDSPLDRLERHAEARVVARVEIPSFRVGELRAAQRVRSLPNLSDAAWDECSERLAPLVGQPIVPGMGRRIRELLADDEDVVRLRDALLQLAPGHIQVLAAITDRWFTQVRETPSAGGSPGKQGPPVGALGGMVDSCYMWRTGSALIGERERLTNAAAARSERADEP